jgi:hypothetical protein
MTRKRKEYLTLAEHDAQLKAQGKWDEYVFGANARDEEIARRSRECALAEVPLVQELHAAGADVTSV